jgi:translation initiation factor 3 subunit F
MEGREKEGQFLADSLACIPKIDLDAFKTVFKSHLQDLDLIAHLANLTKMQLDIASKLQAVLL